jgi:uncharacterized protein YdbL (DUF1318 family)
MSRLFFMLALALAALPAQAGPLEDAKRQGLVGERPDGYLGAPPGARGSDQMIGEINAKRRQAYGEIAGRNGASSDDVGTITGQRLIEQAPPGSWVMDRHGNWQRK